MERLSFEECDGKKRKRLQYEAAAVLREDEEDLWRE